MKISDWSRCATVHGVIFFLWFGPGPDPQRWQEWGVEVKNIEKHTKEKLPWQWGKVVSLMRGGGKGGSHQGWASSP